MRKFITWFFAFWPKLPTMIQRAFALALFVSLVALPITFLVFVLHDGSLQAKLGLEVPTKADLTNAANTITADVATSQNVGLLALKDSLSTVDSTMRVNYLEPGVEILKDLVQRMEQVERNQGKANTSLSSINDNSAKQLQHLEELAQDDTQVDLEGLILRMDANINSRFNEQQQQLDELKRSRTTKKNF